MKRIFFILSLVAFGLGAAWAQDAPQAKNLKIVISGVYQHKDYEELVGGLKRIVGVSDIFVDTEAKGLLVLTGRFAGEINMLVNDAQALVMDRYKFDKKERKEVIEISLKKI